MMDVQHRQHAVSLILSWRATRHRREVEVCSEGSSKLPLLAQECEGETRAAELALLGGGAGASCDCTVVSSVMREERVVCSRIEMRGKGELIVGAVTAVRRDHILVGTTAGVASLSWSLAKRTSRAHR